MSIILINPYRFFAPAPSGLPAIGDAFEGGFFVGTISHTANGVATHALIVAPRETGSSGGGYSTTTNLAWKTATTLTVSDSSVFDGRANTDAIIAAGIADHPAAQFCTSLTIGGYSDWYLPAWYELEIAYFNLKPFVSGNVTTTGTNDYSVPPRTTNYTTSNPPPTTVAAFQSPDGTERFEIATHWSSTELATTSARSISFSTGASANTNKSSASIRTRAFRRVAL